MAWACASWADTMGPLEPASPPPLKRNWWEKGARSKSGLLSPHPHPEPEQLRSAPAPPKPPQPTQEPQSPRLSQLRATRRAHNDRDCGLGGLPRHIQHRTGPLHSQGCHSQGWNSLFSPFPGGQEAPGRWGCLRLFVQLRTKLSCWSVAVCPNTTVWAAVPARSLQHLKKKPQMFIF